MPQATFEATSGTLEKGQNLERYIRTGTLKWGLDGQAEGVKIAMLSGWQSGKDEVF